MACFAWSACLLGRHVLLGWHDLLGWHVLLWWYDMLGWHVLLGWRVLLGWHFLRGLDTLTKAGSFQGGISISANVALLEATKDARQTSCQQIFPIGSLDKSLGMFF